MISFAKKILPIGLLIAVISCGSDEKKSSSSIESVEDATSIIRRSDGKYDVHCRDGRSEVVTAEDVRNNNVCRALPNPVNVFDPASCPGAALSTAEALALIPIPNAISRNLGTTSFKSRIRRCFQVGGCTDWNDNFDGVRDIYAKSSNNNFLDVERQVTLSMVLENNKPTIVIGNAQWSSKGTYEAGFSRTSTASARSNDGTYYIYAGSGYMNWSGKVASSCTWFQATGKVSTQDSSGNSITYEIEAAGVTRF